MVVANGEHDGESNRRPDGEASANPVPDGIDVVFWNTEVLGGFGVGRYGDEVFCQVFFGGLGRI